MISTAEAILYKERNEKDGLRKYHKLTDFLRPQSEDTQDPFATVDNLSTDLEGSDYATEIKNRDIPHNQYPSVLLEDSKKRRMFLEYSDRVLEYVTFYNDNKYIIYTLNNINWDNIEFIKDFPCEQSSSEMRTSGHSHRVPKDVWMLPLELGRMGNYE